MGAESFQNAADLYVQANATLEAARITAEATRDGSWKTVAGGAFALAGGLAAILAAMINTAPARAAARGKREAFRHLAYGELEAFQYELLRSIGRTIMLEYELERRAIQVDLEPVEISVPPSMREDRWENHGLIGADFAREAVLFRAEVADYHVWRADNLLARTQDMMIDPGGESSHTTESDNTVTIEFPQTTAVTAYRYYLNRIDKSAKQLQDLTRTRREKWQLGMLLFGRRREKLLRGTLTVPSPVEGEAHISSPGKGAPTPGGGVPVSEKS